MYIVQCMYIYIFRLHLITAVYLSSIDLQNEIKIVYLICLNIENRIYILSFIQNYIFISFKMRKILSVFLSRYSRLYSLC